jgi:hypothetical protein
MFSFNPNYSERYYVIKITGEFTEEECKLSIQKMLEFAVKINFRKFGSVNDMREFTTMSDSTNKIITRGMELSLKAGFTTVGRVYKEIKQDINKLLNEANLKAGFVANYFNDINKAITFVKNNLAQFSDNPVLTYSELKTYIENSYPEFKTMFGNIKG